MWHTVITCRDITNLQGGQIHLLPEQRLLDVQQPAITKLTTMSYILSAYFLHGCLLHWSNFCVLICYFGALQLLSLVGQYTCWVSGECHYYLTAQHVQPPHLEVSFASQVTCTFKATIIYSRLEWAWSRHWASIQLPLLTGLTQE